MQQFWNLGFFWGWMYYKHMQRLSSVALTLFQIIDKTPVQEGDQQDFIHYLTLEILS